MFLYPFSLQSWQKPGRHQGGRRVGKTSVSRLEGVLASWALQLVNKEIGPAAWSSALIAQLQGLSCTLAGVTRQAIHLFGFREQLPLFLLLYRGVLSGGVSWEVDSACMLLGSI